MYHLQIINVHKQIQFEVYTQSNKLALELVDLFVDQFPHYTVQIQKRS